jgi:hypothetical protein
VAGAGGDDKGRPCRNGYFPAIEEHPELALLDADDLVPVEVNVLYRHVAPRLEDQLRDVGLLAGGKAAEGLSREGVRKGLIGIKSRRVRSAIQTAASRVFFSLLAVSPAWVLPIRRTNG